MGMGGSISKTPGSEEIMVKIILSQTESLKEDSITLILIEVENWNSVKSGRKFRSQGPLHRGSRAGGQRARRGEEGGRGLRLPSRLPAHSLPGWRHWLRHGDTSHLEDQGGVP